MTHAGLVPDSHLYSHDSRRTQLSHRLDERRRVRRKHERAESLDRPRQSLGSDAQQIGSLRLPAESPPAHVELPHRGAGVTHHQTQLRLQVGLLGEQPMEIGGIPPGRPPEIASRQRARDPLLVDVAAVTMAELALERNLRRPGLQGRKAADDVSQIRGIDEFEQRAH